MVSPLSALVAAQLKQQQDQELEGHVNVQLVAQVWSSKQGGK